MIALSAKEPSALETALRYGKEQQAVDLIKAGADIYAVTENDVSTLNGESMLELALRYNVEKAALALIEKGADVNSTSNGQSMLELAEQYGNQEAAAAIREHMLSPLPLNEAIQTNDAHIGRNGNTFSISAKTPEELKRVIRSVRAVDPDNNFSMSIVPAGGSDRKVLIKNPPKELYNILHGIHPSKGR